MTIKSINELVTTARSRIHNLDVSEAMRYLIDPMTVFVDLRDTAEIAAEGTILGAIHMPRGNLEFWIDPASAYFKPIFGRERRFVFFCAAGLRSTLATATAQDMGLQSVSHISGGFRAWKEAGAPIAAEPRQAQDL